MTPEIQTAPSPDSEDRRGAILSHVPGREDVELARQFAIHLADDEFFDAAITGAFASIATPRVLAEHEFPRSQCPVLHAPVSHCSRSEIHMAEDEVSSQRAEGEPSQASSPVPIYRGSEVAIHRKHVNQHRPATVSPPGRPQSPSTEKREDGDPVIDAACPQIVQKFEIPSPNDTIGEEEDAKHSGPTIAKADLLLSGARDVSSEKRYCDVVSERIYRLFETERVPVDLSMAQRAFLIRAFNYSGTSTERTEITDERWNTFTHLAGVTVAIPAAILLVLRCIFDDASGEYNFRVHPSIRAITALVYGLAMSLCFLASTLHHGIGLRSGNWKLYKVLRRLDHVCVLLHIMGTFVPICFGVEHSLLLCTVGCCVVLMGLIVSVIECCTLFMPDLVPPVIILLFQAGIPLACSFAMVSLKHYADFKKLAVNLILGGVAYLSGAIFYALPVRPLRPGVWAGHETFHVLVMLGSFFHYRAVSAAMRFSVEA